MNARQKAALEAIGGPELVRKILEVGQRETERLEGLVDFKGVVPVSGMPADLRASSLDDCRLSKEQVKLIAEFAEEHQRDGKAMVASWDMAKLRFKKAHRIREGRWEPINTGVKVMKQKTLTQIVLDMLRPLSEPPVGKKSVSGPQDLTSVVNDLMGRQGSNRFAKGLKEVLFAPGFDPGTDLSSLTPAASQRAPATARRQKDVAEPVSEMGQKMADLQRARRLEADQQRERLGLPATDQKSAAQPGQPINPDVLGLLSAQAKLTRAGQSMTRRDAAGNVRIFKGNRWQRETNSDRQSREKRERQRAQIDRQAALDKAKVG